MYGLASRVKALTLLALLFGGAAGAERQPREVRPGDASLDGDRVRPGVWEIHYIRAANGGEEEIGFVRQQLDVIEHDGETLLRSVMRFGGPRGTGVDSAMAVRGTLHPRSHRGIQPSGSTLTLDFGDTWVSGVSVEQGKEPLSKRRDLPAPLFDANMFEVVLGALPLGEGLHVRIPTYVFEREDPLWFEARVTGIEDVTVDGVTSAAWAVAVRTERGDGTFWIDRASRQFVKGVFRGPDGAELRMIRSAAPSGD
jgi:hypothetical protein